MAKDKMVGWHHRFNGCKFEQPLGDSEGQGSLVCCSPWGRKETDMNEQLHSIKQTRLPMTHGQGAAKVEFHEVAPVYELMAEKLEGSCCPVQVHYGAM